MGVFDGQIIGNLGQDPELKYTENGSAYLNLSVGVTKKKKKKDKDNGEKKDVTTWVRVNVFGQQAEILAQYLTKGRQVFASGSIEVNLFTKKDGTTGVSVEMAAHSVQMLGSKSEDNNQSQAQPQQTKANAAKATAETKFTSNTAVVDDTIDESDIPF